MRYWLTTDTHLGHGLLERIGARPDGFTRLVLKRLGEVLREDDVLVHLGDVCLGRDEYWHQRLAEVVPCRRWLVRGNHDRKSDVWYLRQGWDFVGERVRLRRHGLEIVFSHKPVELWEGDGVDLNIHGHFHDTDFRKHEPEMARIVDNSERHHLLALEKMDYRPTLLQKVVERFQATSKFE